VELVASYGEMSTSTGPPSVSTSLARQATPGLPRDPVTSDLWCREVPLEGCSPCPGPIPQEFREDVIRVARTREPDTRLKDIAKDFGISESCLNGWLKSADVEDGIKPGLTDAEHAENRETP
jgi:hypothetical protein